jgi:hypothetical protein
MTSPSGVVVACARRAPIIHVFVPSRNSLVERGTVFGHVFHMYGMHLQFLRAWASDGTTLTSRGRVGLRKRVANFFPLPHTGWETGGQRVKTYRRLDDAIQRGDLDRRPRLVCARKGK